MEHIKRCYLIPFAIGIALLFLLRVSLFLDGGGGRGDAIRASLFWAVLLAPVILLYIGIADTIINRRVGTFGTSTDIAYFFSVFIFFVVPVSLILWPFLPYIAIAGTASALISGRMMPAIVSGIAVLALSFPFLIFALMFICSLGNVAFWIMLLSFLAGGGILVIAFITHTNTALSKLRILYLIPFILLVPFQFFMLANPHDFSFIAEAVLFLKGVSFLAGGGFLSVAFIAHSNMELYKKALYFIPLILIAPSLLLLLARWSFPGGDLFKIESTLWQLLQLWMVGGCIMIGINGVIYSNDSNIDPHKDSPKL